jgi:hypothetical protein
MPAKTPRGKEKIFCSDELGSLHTVAMLSGGCMCAGNYTERLVTDNKTGIAKTPHVAFGYLPCVELCRRSYVMAANTCLFHSCSVRARVGFSLPVPPKIQHSQKSNNPSSSL